MKQTAVLISSEELSLKQFEDLKQSFSWCRGDERQERKKRKTRIFQNPCSVKQADVSPGLFWHIFKLSFTYTFSSLDPFIFGQGACIHHLEPRDLYLRPQTAIYTPMLLCQGKNQYHIFRCVHASLYEGLSVRPSVGRSVVRPAFFLNRGIHLKTPQK